jgi:hypothetical protein
VRVDLISTPNRIVAMCYSALVRQDLQWLVKRYGAEIAWEMFEELYLKRLDDPDIQVARALDVHVMRMQSEAALKSQSYIEAYRTNQVRTWEVELFKQRKRLADAQRKLKSKETKTARSDERIATNKIETLTSKLTLLRSDRLQPDDSRIFPKKYFAPVVTSEGGRLLIRPLRYLCRPPGMPSNLDDLYPGIYNAFGAFLTVSS